MPQTGVFPVHRWLAALAIFVSIPVFAQDTEPFADIGTVNSVRVWRVGGTPRQIGEKTGKKFGEEIRWLYAKYFETYTDDPELKQQFVDNAHVLEKYLPEEAVAELKGLADGCGLEYEQVLIVHTFLDSLRKVNCSTFVLQPPATKDDELIFGRNLDFPGKGVAHKHTIVEVVSPKGKNRFLMVTWPGMQGVLSGMNEHGLCVAVMNVYFHKDSLKGIPYVWLFRKVLEECKTFDEAVALVKKGPRTCANNLMVVDAEGKCGVLELEHSGVAVREPKDGSVIATNHFRLSGPATAWACPRWYRMTQLEETWKGKIGLPEARKMLRSVPQGEMTLQSMIFLPKTREMQLAIGELPATKGKYRALGDLFEEK